MKLQTLKPRLQQASYSRLKTLDTKAGTTVRIRGGIWSATIRRIKQRDSYTCASCGLVRRDHEVDHIIPLEQGGSNGDHNLQLLCKPHAGGKGCHAAKTKTEAQSRAGLQR